MHEVDIARKIVLAAEKVARESGLSKPAVIRLKIGKMSGLEPEQLKILFDAVEKPPLLQNARLEITEIPVKFKCGKCGSTFRDARFDNRDYAHTISHLPFILTLPACPKCGKTAVDRISGNEFKFIGVDEW